MNEAKNNATLDWKTFKYIFLKVGFFMINLMAVYFLEYMCTTCFADRITKKLNTKYPERKDEYIYKNGFVILSFCYQIGVFISRSSLAVIKVPRVEIMTIL